MSNVLDHTPMEYRWIIFTQNLGGDIISLYSVLGEILHNIPEIINIFLTLLKRQPISNNNKTLFLEMLPPILLILEPKSIGLIQIFNLHNLFFFRLHFYHLYYYIYFHIEDCI